MQWRLFERDGGEHAPGSAPAIAPLDTDGDTGAPLLCAACGRAITSEGARVTAFGAHVYTRVNPHGWEYRFGCFREAPGCRPSPSSVPSKQATWFPGFWWYVQICGSCGAHLGWQFFDDAGAEFYGLVLDALVSGAQGSPRPGV
jgi:hypothetical protein